MAAINMNNKCQRQCGGKGTLSEGCAKAMVSASRPSRLRPPQLEPWLQGSLITCNMNQHTCKRRPTYSLLNEYVDHVYRTKKFSGKHQRPSGSEGEDDDVEAALKKEVGDIKASTEMRLRRFQLVGSGENNVVFIRTLGIRTHIHSSTIYKRQTMEPALVSVSG
uniref:Uncharacterized protein n=1 Tax=Sciurus vulgaris TaxID=55149 RepID=A0A8D2E105_SCIVU